MADTPNLGLHQWQPQDSFLRTDFNQDFSKIDTAIGAGLKMVQGSFVTDNTDNRAITLGFKPKLLLFGPSYDSSGQPNWISGFAAEGMCFIHHYNSNVLETKTPLVYTTEEGFTVQNGKYLNYGSGNTTYYTAFY